MGRGRQKAKHTKVARELKYFSPDTNYNALERELTHPVTGAPIDPKLEEDLEKWPEFSAPSFTPPVENYRQGFSPAEEFTTEKPFSTKSSLTEDDAFAADQYEADQNKTA